MYQAVYPWLCQDQFALEVPRQQNNSMWSDPTRKMVDTLRDTDPERVTFTDRGRHINMTSTYGEDDCLTTGPTIQTASHKLLNFLSRRDVHVVYHGADTCSDKKPWARYEHFPRIKAPKSRGKLP